MNRYSPAYNHNDQLSLEDLRAYQADQLSGPARHRVERLMLENPFYADALDGLDALQQVGGSLKLQTRDLHIALQERVHESATPRRLMPLWVTSMVASVLLVISVAIYLIFNKASVQTQAVQAIPSQIEPGTVLLNPKDLGNPEPIETAPKTVSIVAKRTAQKPVVHSRKIARKGRHRAAKPIVTPVDVPVLTSFQTVSEEMPLLPRIEPEVRDLRHVNTERAFLN